MHDAHGILLHDQLTNPWQGTGQEQRWLSEQRQEARQATHQMLDGINRFVVGLPHVVRLVVMGLLADGQVKPGKTVCGHVLLEAVPGTAKTLLSETLASLLKVPFARIQMDTDSSFAADRSSPTAF